MVATAEELSLGLPVEIGKIDRELKKLWAESGSVMTRASLMNLAVYSEAPGSLPLNTEIIFKITEDHAVAARGVTFYTSSLAFSVLDPLGHQRHRSGPLDTYLD